MLRTTKKSPPVHKRHTKPCKYFQQGNCSLRPEVCNFAHIVVSPQIQPKPVTVCRFFTTGTCHNGSYCPYKHTSEAESPYQPRVHIAGQEPRGEWHSLSSPVDSVYHDGPPMYGNYPPYSGFHHEWSYAAGVNAHPPPPPGYPPRHISPSRSTVTPKFNNSPPFGSRSSSEFSPSPSIPFPVHVACGQSHFTARTDSNSTHNTTTSSSSDDTSTTGSSSFSSSSTDPEVELIVATTEDPKYEEHRHEHQSQVVISDQPGPEHVSPFVMKYPNRMGNVGPFGYQPPPPLGGYRPQSYRVGSNSTPGSRTTSRNSQHKTKPIKYRTKPCKFWAANGSCATGDECTFRHDEPMPAVPPQYATTQASYSPSPKPVEAPKPRLSPKENYFPISWRVIGGGVLIGNVKGEDGRSVASDDSIPTVPRSPPSEKEPLPTAKPPSLPPLQTPGRKRSNSIPPTPSSAQVVVGNLFSAESPGVL